MHVTLNVISLMVDLLFSTVPSDYSMDLHKRILFKACLMCMSLIKSPQRIKRVIFQSFHQHERKNYSLTDGHVDLEKENCFIGDLNCL